MQPEAHLINLAKKNKLFIPSKATEKGGSMKKIFEIRIDNDKLDSLSERIRFDRRFGIAAFCAGFGLEIGAAAVLAKKPDKAELAGKLKKAGSACFVVASIADADRMWSLTKMVEEYGTHRISGPVKATC